ncbi:MAG: hypothetical protein GTN69_04705 [Armatimonadetes bacterium]|nr:hypothetical protein [Armatimonadota bacterium]NIO75185.1 hypothetical protein [Armatimonadota bacterium]NIO95804.1 hypothetical protein [Armatimonadota bacterium]
MLTVVGAVVLLFVLSVGASWATITTIYPARDWACATDQGTSLDRSSVPAWAVQGTTSKVTALSDDSDTTYIYDFNDPIVSDTYGFENDVFTGTATSVQIRVRGNRGSSGWCKGLLGLKNGSTSNNLFNLSTGDLAWSSLTYTYDGASSGWTAGEINQLVVSLEAGSGVTIAELEVIINGTTTLDTNIVGDAWKTCTAENPSRSAVYANTPPEEEPQIFANTYGFPDDEFTGTAKRQEIWGHGMRCSSTGPTLTAFTNLLGAATKDDTLGLPMLDCDKSVITYNGPEGGWTQQEINDMTTTLFIDPLQFIVRLTNADGETAMWNKVYSSTTPYLLDMCKWKPSSKPHIPGLGGDDHEYDHEAAPNHVSLIADSSDTTYISVQGTTRKSETFAMGQVDLGGNNAYRIDIYLRGSRYKYSSPSVINCKATTNLPGATRVGDAYYTFPRTGIGSDYMRYDGNWSQEDLDDLLITVESSGGGSSSNHVVKVYKAWAKVYY